MIIIFKYDGKIFKINDMYLPKDCQLVEFAKDIIEESGKDMYQVNLGELPEIGGVSARDIDNYLEYKRGNYFTLTKGFFNIASYNEGLDNYLEYPEEYAYNWLKDLRRDVVSTNIGFHESDIIYNIIKKVAPEGWFVAGNALMYDGEKIIHLYYVGNQFPKEMFMDNLSFENYIIRSFKKDYSLYFHKTIFKTIEDLLYSLEYSRIAYNGRFYTTPLTNYILNEMTIYINPYTIDHENMITLMGLSTYFTIKLPLFKPKKFHVDEFISHVCDILKLDEIRPISYLQHLRNTRKISDDYNNTIDELLVIKDLFLFAMMAHVYHYIPEIFYIEDGRKDEPDEHWRFYKSPKYKELKDVVQRYRDTGFYD